MSENKKINKKTKNIIITIIEIIVVAGIIFGVLMFIYSRVNKEADNQSNLSNKTNQETKSKYDKKYLISVNKAKQTIIVYSYTTDINQRKAEKVMLCSVSEKVKTGNYKTSDAYSWMKNDKSWHHYNVSYDDKCYIQSVSYKDKFSNTLQRDSYNKIGTKQNSGKNIYLYSKDAYWIKKYCKNKVVVEIIKGKKTDLIPLQYETKIPLLKGCGWDPTDPNKDNPYSKKVNGKIVQGLSTVTIEKGSKVNYLDNLIALDTDGSDVTKNLKYKKFKSSNLGKQVVDYSYKNKAGEIVTLKQVFKVVDTTPPKVSLRKTNFEFELKSLDKKDVIKQSNIDAIKKMVRDQVVCNEDCNIDVVTIDKEDLNKGNVPVAVNAKDASGNIGSCNVNVKVKVKEAEPQSKFKPSKKQLKKSKKKVNNSK